MRVEQKKWMSYFWKARVAINIEADIEELKARIATIETEMEQNALTLLNYRNCSWLTREWAASEKQASVKEYLSELE